jgi:DNA-binding GntR family transcriptional regulator
MQQHHYQKLKETLKKKIIKGIYKTGEPLPSEHELTELYQLARYTVRQALDELVKEGFITKHKGKGSIVAERKRKALGLFSVKGFSAIVGEEGEVDTVFLKKPYSIEWGEDFFYPLTKDEIKKGAVCFERLRSAGGSPVMLEYTYVPGRETFLIDEADFVRNSLFETLHVKFNIDIIKAEQELVASGAGKNITKVFGIEKGTPVLHVYRRYHTNRPGFFVYSSFYCYTGEYSIGNVFE